MTALFCAEWKKVWGQKVFILAVAVLACANLLMLWIETQPGEYQPPASAYRQVERDLSGLTMEEKGELLHSRCDQWKGLGQIAQYYEDVAMGYYFPPEFRQLHADVFETYEQQYLDRDYTLYTQNLSQEYQLYRRLVEEYDTVAGYADFLDSVQAKAGQLAGISVFQQDRSGYDLKNIEKTARAYEGLHYVKIDYEPQIGLLTAMNYAFTDFLLLAAMLLLALLLVRQERDSGLLDLVRSTPGGRLQTAVAKLLVFAGSLFVVLLVLYGVNLWYCGAMFGLGDLSRTVQSVPFLMRSAMQVTVRQYLQCFLLAKWAGTLVMGLWIMAVVLGARRTMMGWAGAISLPVAMYLIRQAIPAASRMGVIRCANLVSLMQTNELLGNYRNLYWFGTPVSLPFVEWLSAILFGAAFAAAFCGRFACGQLRTASSVGLQLPLRHQTRPTSVPREEARKLFVQNGAVLVLVLSLGLSVWQGAHSVSHMDAEERYYAEYMQDLSGPYTWESYHRLEKDYREFIPMLSTQNQVSKGILGKEALYPYVHMQQKYQAFGHIVNENINWYLKEHPNAWLVYESGYTRFFGLEGTADLREVLLAGLLCALCCAGLFAMERKGGMAEVLCATPLGRKKTVHMKLTYAFLTGTGIAGITALPRLWRILRDYGLPTILAPAMSLQAYEQIPVSVTLLDLVLLWLAGRLLGCMLLVMLTLWLSDHLENSLLTLFVASVAFCLPPLLALSGMGQGVAWFGVWLLFHVTALLAYAPEGLAWTAPALLLAGTAILTALAIQMKVDWEYQGVRPLE